jgi:MGT family glycosyltransferase
MADILIATLSHTGHVSPMLSIAADLVARGNRVTVMTGAANAGSVRAVGATLHPLPPSADLDHSRFGSSVHGGTSGIAALNLAIIQMYVVPMPNQAVELAAAMARTPFDAIVVDYGFFGIIPFLLGDAASRPPVLYYTPTPLTLSSRDTPPTGLGLPPRGGTVGRLRNRLLNAFSHKVLLGQSHRAVNAMLKEIGAPRLPIFLMDVGVLADRVIVPTVPTFEYPRSDLPPNVRFVGRVRAQPSSRWDRPDWWSRLDDDRPVVYVTQGSVDNDDLSRLIEPTIRALGDDDVFVVVTTGGRDVVDLQVALPANTVVAEHIPPDLLLPKVDVMVTNGGYGAVQRAVSTGVPLVVAGSGNDEPEVAARVAWSGAGIDLRTGTPTPDAIRGAVRRVLDDGSYLRRARELETDFAQRDGIAEIAALVEELTGNRFVTRTSSARRRNSASPSRRG